MLQWEIWVAASPVIIILSSFWLGTEQRWGGKDVGFGWYFANPAEFYKVFWKGCESSELPETFILVSKIWIMLRWARNSSVGCLSLFQSLQTRYALSPLFDVCWFTLRKHARTLQTCFVNSWTREARTEICVIQQNIKVVLLSKSTSSAAPSLLSFCSGGQTLSKCIYKLLSSFPQPLATYRWWQKLIAPRKHPNVRVLQDCSKT